ncbi:hypothetical protein D3C72_1925860 [compost metagenome]
MEQNRAAINRTARHHRLDQLTPVGKRDTDNFGYPFALFIDVVIGSMVKKSPCTAHLLQLPLNLVRVKPVIRA